MSSQQKNIIIIGAGFGGLSAAALLAKDGHTVTVLEKNKQLGGRAQQLKKDGFTFDMGPSWYMMPDVFERFFAEFGKTPEDFLELVKLDPQYRVIFGDGSHVDMAVDLEENKKLFESIEPGSAAKFEEYLDEGQLKYDVAMRSVLYKNVDSVVDFFSWDMIRYGLKMHPFMKMEQYMNRFFKSEKLKQIIQFTLVFLGGAPHNMPALYSLISYVDFKLHTFYPKGGMHSVVDAFEAVGKEQGVTFKTGEAVEKVITDGDTVTAVKTNKATYKADVVIANADMKHFDELLDDTGKKQFSEEYWQERTLAPSAFLLYLGVKGKLKKLQHHTIFYGNDWQQHFKDIFDAPDWPKEPSVYINIPSRTEPSMAPKGHEAVMVLVPIAVGLPEDKKSKEKYADFIIEYLEKRLDIKLKKHIVSKTIFSVTDFEKTYNSYKGNALGGLAHTLFQTGPWRPSNKHVKLRNVFFSGANTVPGIGVPPAVISGHLVRERVQKLE